jgi:hypothetical protein
MAKPRKKRPSGRRPTPPSALEERLRRMEKRLLTLERIVADEATDGIWPPSPTYGIRLDATDEQDG